MLATNVKTRLLLPQGPCHGRCDRETDRDAVPRRRRPLVSGGNPRVRRTAGDPARASDHHDGCGAAVRVAPVGILYDSRRLDDLVAGAREASISTHGGPLALAAVSATIDGATPLEIVELARRAAERAESEGSGRANGVFAQAIRDIHADLHRSPALRPADVAVKYFPADPLTIVPLALALATIMESAEAAILLAANIGGDSDSVASIAGAILGARSPGTVNDDWYAVVETVNDHRRRDVAANLRRDTKTDAAPPHLTALSEELTGLRH